ncbi:MAG: carboxypeptidase-like regulatory domain-containing protein [Vicinamibacterales bacterium]
MSRSTHRTRGGLVAVGLIVLPAALLAALTAGRLAAASRTTQAPLTAPAPGTLAGTVVDAATRAPIAGAVVTLEARLVRGDAVPSVMTDASGRFRFTSLPSDEWAIRAVRPGYLSGGYGQAQLGVEIPTRPFTLPPDRGLADVVIALRRPAVIEGRVTDAANEPVVGVTVQAIEVSSARSDLSPQATTDDLGHFVLTVAPGRYRVVVPRQYVSWAVGERVLGPRPATRETVPPVTEVRSADGRFRMDRGRTDPAPPMPDGRDAIYVTTFAPGVTDLAAATVVEAASGEHFTADIPLVQMSRVSVTGRVTGPDGPAAQTVVRLVRAGQLGAPGLPDDAPQAGTASDGTFRFLAVAPGSYEVHVFRQLHDYDVALPDHEGLWARSTLIVDDRDVTGLEFVLSRGVTVTGRVVIDDPAVSPRRLGVGLASRDPDRTRSGHFAEMDGAAFRIAGVIPGEYTLTASGDGLLLVSAMYRGRDIAVEPVEIDRDLEQVEVLLTAHPASVDGVVRSGRGPARDAAVLLFPEDPRRRTWPFDSSSRVHVMAVRPDGSFTFDALAPGDYLIAAVPSYGTRTRASLDLLARLAGDATRLSLGPGEARSIDLVVRQP